MVVRDITEWMETIVEVLEIIIAGFFVILLAVGVLNFGTLIARVVIEQRLIELDAALGLISSSINIVLYLFVVVELFRTVVAYVQSESVVIAVIHAGLIGVVRQIITFKPGEYDGLDAALMAGGVYALLLLALLIGFFVVHRQIDEA